MTMIEANRGAPLIMHAPKHVADLGRAGLRANIENGTVIIPEKSVHSGAYVYFPEQDDLQCARGDDLDGEPVGKKMVEGDDSSVERLKEEVEKSGEATDPSLVRRRTLDRRAMPGGLDHMTEFLVGDEAWEGAKDNQWNEHHSRILDLIMFASLDEDTFRRDSKMEYLVHLCSDAVNSISQLEARSICNRLVGFPVALDSLVERDFFLFADADAPASRKMEAVCMHLMRGSASAEQIKSFLERNVHFKNELSDAEINGSHSLVVEMLETVAVGAADRSKFLREYLVELLSAQQHLFSAPENGKWIAEMDTKYAAAAALLRDIGVFDALPVHSDEEANSDLGVSEAGIHNADVEDISIEDRMNQALALARNASAGDVGEYLDGFAYWKEGFAQEEFNDCHLLIIRMLDVSVENRDSFVTTSLLQILDAKATLIRREEVVEVVQRFSRAYHRLEMDDFFR
ncbi:hypothetical protein LMG27198_14870 [Methylocystis echinoides]|uniref:Uncharacterized protein n=2 Tax=Methylocystis echinoides TaxID=29468 RepID=A0A9W6LRD0_9HYPH|nr:hypothetical protein LMG27198_14870 [Methylocystis echinoides]